MSLKLRIILPKFAFSFLFLLLGLSLIVSTAMGWANYQGKWEDTYPYSATIDANCQICHSDVLETLNTYGRDICLADGDNFESRLTAVETLDSDGDGTSNLLEIQFNAQPGWTEADNLIYESDFCEEALPAISVPTSVPLPYDPVINCVIFLPFVVNSDN
jgi:hypothetical protein